MLGPEGLDEDGPRALEALRGRVELPLLREDHADLTEGPADVRVLGSERPLLQRQRPLVRCQRGIEPALLEVDPGKLPEHLGELHLVGAGPVEQGQRPLELRARGGVVLAQGEQVAEEPQRLHDHAVVRAEGVLEDAQAALVQGLRPGVVRPPHRDDREVDGDHPERRVRRAGRLLDDGGGSLVVRLRLGQPRLQRVDVGQREEARRDHEGVRTRRLLAQRKRLLDAHARGGELALLEEHHADVRAEIGAAQRILAPALEPGLGRLGRAQRIVVAAEPLLGLHELDLRV